MVSNYHFSTVNLSLRNYHRFYSVAIIFQCIAIIITSSSPHHHEYNYYYIHALHKYSRIHVVLSTVHNTHYNSNLIIKFCYMQNRIIEYLLQ